MGQTCVGSDKERTRCFPVARRDDLIIGIAPHAPLAFKPVLQTYTSVVDHLLLLTIQNPDGTTETLATTDQHPFWVENPAYGPEGGMWVRAGLLTPGMTLLDDQGHPVTLIGTQTQSLPNGVQVYNLEVDTDHTYFVLDANGVPVWVHNGLGCGPYKSNVRPHHVLSGAAMRNALNYAYRGALAASSRLLDRLGVRHGAISGAQNTVYAALRKSGAAPTLLRIAKAEIKAMTKAGIEEGLARALISRAIEDLRRMGVTNGPWRWPGS